MPFSLANVAANAKIYFAIKATSFSIILSEKYDNVKSL